MNIIKETYIIFKKCIPKHEKNTSPENVLFLRDMDPDKVYVKDGFVVNEITFPTPLREIICFCK